MAQKSVDEIVELLQQDIDEAIPVFVSDVKGSIANMLTSSELLEDMIKDGELDIETMTAMIHIIKESGQRMLNYVNALRQFDAKRRHTEE